MISQVVLAGACIVISSQFIAVIAVAAFAAAHAVAVATATVIAAEGSDACAFGVSGDRLQGGEHRIPVNRYNVTNKTNKTN